jgi:hypothetical protein
MRLGFPILSGAMKLRTFLLAVIGLTLVTMLVVAGTAIWWAHQDERLAMEQALLYHARSLTVAVDREVETSLAGLRGLAASGDLDSADLRRFYEQARLAREASPRWLTAWPGSGSAPLGADHRHERHALARRPAEVVRERELPAARDAGDLALARLPAEL